ncbi:MAG: hypothetical protein ACOCNM_00050 [Prevotella pectinovora]
MINLYIFAQMPSIALFGNRRIAAITPSASSTVPITVISPKTT